MRVYPPKTKKVSIALSLRETASNTALREAVSSTVLDQAESGIISSETVDGNDESELKKDIITTEAFIDNVINQTEIFYYSKFLEKVYGNTSKENHDVARVYSDLKSFCSHYLNRLKRFDCADVSVEVVMKVIREGIFEAEYMVADDDYEEEFLREFNFDLDKLDLKDRVTLLETTIRYYLLVLQSLTRILSLKIWTSLDLRSNNFKRLASWKFIINKLRNVVGIFNYVDLKGELLQFMALGEDDIADLKKHSSKHSILGWKFVKENLNEANRFKNLLHFVQALFSIPYANGDIERSFNQLKLVKTKKRELLSERNFSSLIIVNKVSRKRKIAEVEREIIHRNALKEFIKT